MQSRKVSIFSKYFKEIRALQKRAFPKEEQYPLPILLLLSLQKSVNYTAYYDAETLCGISYTAETDDMIYVLYLAVNDKLRSKGYGTKILDVIRSCRVNKTVCLNVESLDEMAENNEQRKKRYEFYYRNGFHDTEHFLEDKTGRYAILAAGGDFSADSYKEAIRRLWMNLYKPKIYSYY